MVDISGRCKPGFEAVKDAFASNFEQQRRRRRLLRRGPAGRTGRRPLGRHARRRAAARPWEEDTIINVFSTTKTMSCLSLLVLASRGLVDVDAPVARYWPEFEQNGKEGVLVRHLLSHTAGLPGWDQRLDVTDLYDWDKVTGLLAAQAPWWEPGWKSGYHGITQGNLVGEVVRRVDGRTVGQLLRGGDRQAPRRRLPHRHPGRARRPGRPRHPRPAARLRRRRRSAARARQDLHPLPGLQPPPGGRGLLDDPVAPGRDPRRRRPRQRPQRGPGPVRRCRPAVRPAASTC